MIPTFNEFYKVFSQHERDTKSWYYLNFKIEYIKPLACFAVEYGNEDFSANSEFEIYGIIVATLENNLEKLK
jgi:hypothetical protein